jgi:uncharacterized protein YndB with AHSA1/START domain
MRKNVLRVLGGLAGLVALILIWGLLMPRNHVATSAVVIGAAPESVWVVVRDLGGLPAWWPDVTRSERRADQAGREIWDQTSSGWAMGIVVTEDDAPRRLVTTIDETPGAGFGGAWTYELIPEPPGTRVRVTERGWVANPLFRVMSALGGHHTTLDSYLTALGRRFGSTVTPEHVAPPPRIEP